MVKKGLFCILIAVTLMSILATTFACTSPTSPPSKETPKREIRIGVMAGVTGPAPAAVTIAVEEMEFIFKYMNEVEGGVEGAKLSWRVVDNKGTPDGAIMAYKELRDTFKPLLYMAVEDYYLTGILDTLTTDKAVVLTRSAISAKDFVPPGRMFSTSLPTVDGFAGYVKWVLEHWKKAQPQQSRPPKIGVFYWDLPSGLQWKMAEGWAKKQGVELVPATFQMTGVDFKPQLMILRDAKVDYIWMMAVTPNAVIAVRDIRGLGMEKIPFTFMEYAEPHNIVALTGGSAEGFYQYRTESPYSDNTEAAKLYSKILKRSTNKEVWSDNRLEITTKAILSTAIKETIKDTGWEKMDSEALYQALNKLTMIDTWGNMKDFGYGPNKRIGVSAMKMSQYTKTGTVSISDWIQLPRIFEGIEK